ncbi:MAG: RNA-binding protein [Hyphomicrobiaceae bacterium]
MAPAAARERKMDAGAAEKAAAERTCALTRQPLTPEDGLRFVVGPDGRIVPDVGRRLPGRGVWLACSRAVVAEAARKGAFQRSLKRPVTVPENLADLVETLLTRRAVEALSLANKAGLVTTGFTKVEIAIQRGACAFLVHASDAAADGVAKLDRKFVACLENSGAEAAQDDAANGSREHLRQHILDCLTSAELSLAIGRPNVVHAALAHGGAATRFSREAERLRRYRAPASAHAPSEPGSRARSEQA